jgi:AcrR family transcriptional regulator
MSPQAREQMILDEAIELFAEQGFDAQIRTLADRLCVSQALIFRYFATKETLVDRVYQQTFLARWNPGWPDMLSDRNRPLQDRLLEFLRSYLRATDDSRWIRISMHSSLSGQGLTKRYVEVYLTDLLRQIAREVRHHKGRSEDAEITETELEVVWHLHSTVIYYLVRKHITKTAVSFDTDHWLEEVVTNFVAGLG